VLGGNAIHSRRILQCRSTGCRLPTGRPRYVFAVCELLEFDEQYTVQAYRRHGPIDATGAPMDEHSQCVSVVELDLLHVCRQIYAEARLLPFKENVFVSDTRENDVNLAFIREFNPLQASAIGGLSFRCFNGFPRISEPDATRLARSHWLKLLEAAIDTYTTGSPTELLQALDRTIDTSGVGLVCGAKPPAVCVRLNVIADPRFLQSARDALETTTAWLEEKQGTLFGPSNK
jgi:hypothetical protein